MIVAHFLERNLFIKSDNDILFHARYRVIIHFSSLSSSIIDAGNPRQMYNKYVFDFAVCVYIYVYRAHLPIVYIQRLDIAVYRSEKDVA